MASEEEQTAQLERKRPVRLSRSGDPTAVKAIVVEEGSEDLGEVALPVHSAEEAWNGGGRVPDWLIRVVALVLPVLGIWLLGSVAVRKMREPDQPVIPAVEPEVGDRGPQAVARAFLAAGSTEERLALSFRRELTELRVAQFAPAALATAVEPTRFEPLGPARVMGELRYFRFGVESPGIGRRLLCVVDTADGLLVDWDAFARYGTVPAGGPHQGEFSEALARVFIKADRYYNYSFPDENRWVSFELRSPDWESPVFGYTKSGTTTQRILTRLVGRAGPGGRRVTLALDGKGSNPDHRQFVIDRVLAAGWVLGEDEFEALWEHRAGLRQRASRGETAGP